ncbi:tight adherence protein TadC [Salinisphaera sp. T5B8]|uniref:type II secretion system F family protein n=1 Tax=Salinisphaera sp. T5B8 TaxID=1304154 RepID=UPI003340FDCC
MSWAALFFALAVATLVLALGVGLLFWLERAREARLYARYTGVAATAGEPAARRDHPWLSRMAAGGVRIERALNAGEQTRTLLAQAGWRQTRARLMFHALSFAVPVATALLITPVLLTLATALTPPMRVLLAVMLVIVALLLPRFVLRWRARARRDRIEADVLLFINLLVLLFEAGLGMRQALAILARDARDTMPALADELAPLVRQIEAGADADPLLHETGKLLEIEALENVFAVLRQVERYGGEIRQPLLDSLNELQSRRSMALREQVNKTSARMTIVLVLCFLPPLLIFIAGPALMSISAALGSS